MGNQFYSPPLNLGDITEEEEKSKELEEVEELHAMFTPGTTQICLLKFPTGITCTNLHMAGIFNTCQISPQGGAEPH